MSEDLQGRAAVMTGAGGGMGLQIARDLQAAGCNVRAIDLKPEPSDFAVGPGQAVYVEGDATDEALVKSTIRQAYDDWGRLDYVVNAAGVGWYETDTSIVEMDLDVWRRVLDINLNAAALVARHAVPYLKKTGPGAMVHIASVVGLRNMENIIEGGPMDAYQASKSALVGLSRSLAMQLAADGIRSNTICPGAVLTPMIQPIYDADPAREVAMAARTPLKRLGKPTDISNACLFLLSDKASFITGIDLVVDGGLMAKL